MQTRTPQPAPFLKKAFREAFGICIIAAILALAVNAIRPGSLALVRPNDPSGILPAASGESDRPRPIETIAALDYLKTSGAVFLDARSEYDFKAGHIAGALNRQEINLDTWMPAFFEKIPPETVLVTYCSDPQCHLAENLAATLYEMGYTNSRYMPAGWLAWLAAAYPTEDGL